MAIVVGARELRNRLGTYLRLVRSGTRVIVTDRGRAVAEIRDIAAGAGGIESRLLAMTAEGLVTPRLHADLVARNRVTMVGATLSDAVIEDRSSSPPKRSRLPTGS